MTNQDHAATLFAIEKLAEGKTLWINSESGEWRDNVLPLGTDDLKRLADYVKELETDRDKYKSALESMVAAFNPHFTSTQPKDIVQVTQECAINVACDDLGWPRLVILGELPNER